MRFIARSHHLLIISSARNLPCGLSQSYPYATPSKRPLMPKITYFEFNGAKHIINVEPGTTVMEGAVKNQVPGIDAECGGACACATCHVYVDQDWAGRLPKPQSDELELLKELPDFREATSRLSCQVDFTEALSGLKVAIAPDS